jgi:glycosyltransferase involved in cell wall biosynthesis
MSLGAPASAGISSLLHEMRLPVIVLEEQMSGPRITVIIPTRERCETLGASIRTCVEQDYDNLEIVVSDNASQDDTEAVVRSFNDPRLRYIKTDRRLSMTSNYEFALGHARSGFIAIIGDDDGLMPGAAATVADLVKQTGVEAVANYSVRYAWPNHLIEKSRNQMRFDKMDRKIEFRDPRAELAALVSFRRGGRVYYYWELPIIYHGFVSSEVIERAKRDGRYFHSINPDVYSALVNSLVIDRFLRVHQPLTVEGSSGRSTGASSISGIDRTEESRVLAENDLPFSPDLVYAPSIPIVIAEAYLQVRARFPDACKDHDFSIARVCGAALRDASGPNKDRITQAVNEILAKHQVAAADPETLFSPLNTVWHRFFEAFTSCEVDCEIFGVRDVYQASWLAHNLLTLRYEGGVRSGASRILSKLRNKFARS